MWSGRGKLLGDVARGRRPEDPAAQCHAHARRSGRRAARRRAAIGARIVTGQRLDAKSGPRTADADLIVGADGIWSATRPVLDPSAPQPAYAGLYLVSGASGSVPAGLPRDGFNWIFARHGVFIFIPAPDGTVWWTAQVATPEAAARLGRHRTARAHRLFGTEVQASAVLEAATTVGPAHLGHVLKPPTCRYHDRTRDHRRRRTPGRRRAWRLHRDGRRGNPGQAPRRGRAGAIPAALAAFDRERQPRAGKLAKMEASNRDAKTAGPVGARMREMIMPHVFNRFFEKATGWLYDFDPGTLPAPAEAEA